MFVPLFQITIKTKDNEVDYFALVDSGADICLFPAEIGEFLGIDIESGKKEIIAGVVQNQLREYYIHRVKMNVGGWEHSVKVGFMPELSRLGYGLLGQHGFFDKFKSVEFKKPKDILEIKT